ncbi:MAG: peroxiredoxin family protein [Actinomycetota bacterium]|nr:peroxiredoxin family protein [Actinomycetota bacterium]
MLGPGDKAPSFALPDATTGALVRDPWTDGHAVVAFFKTTCPVCQMVGPKLTALMEAGAPVIGVGQDPPAKLQAYANNHGQRIPTVSESPPYELSTAFGLSVVPTLFRVDTAGVI